MSIKEIIVDAKARLQLMEQDIANISEHDICTLGGLLNDLEEEYEKESLSVVLSELEEIKSILVRATTAPPPIDNRPKTNIKRNFIVTAVDELTNVLVHGPDPRTYDIVVAEEDVNNNEVITGIVFNSYKDELIKLANEDPDFAAKVATMNVKLQVTPLPDQFPINVKGPANDETDTTNDNDN